jgi:hypothetical protein
LPSVSLSQTIFPGNGGVVMALHCPVFISID